MSLEFNMICDYCDMPGASTSYAGGPEGEPYIMEAFQCGSRRILSIDRDATHLAQRAPACRRIAELLDEIQALGARSLHPQKGHA